MLKNFAMMLVLVISTMASADVRTYDVRATRARGSSDQCGRGTTDRMMKDRHIIKIYDDGTVRVNGFKWTVVAGEPDLDITFHDDEGQLVALEMSLYVNMRGLSGVYIIRGVDHAGSLRREPCVDVVYIDGAAR